MNSNEIQPNHFSSNRKIKVLFALMFLLLAVFAVSFYSTGREQVNIVKKVQIGMNPNLIFQRQFSLYDSFTFLKNSSLCSEQKLVNNQTQKFCHGITSNFTFLVVNLTNLIPEDNSTKIIDLYLYLNSLTFNNETHTVAMGGANFTVVNSTSKIVTEENNINSKRFESFIVRDKEINETNLTNLIPLVMFQMHLNGSFYNIKKPVNLSLPELDHMMELISEFSTKLSSDLYNHNSNRDYLEEFGSSFVRPKFLIHSEQNLSEELMTVSKLIDKEHHVSMKFPNSSIMRTVLRSNFNKTNGFLVSTYLESVGRFEGEKVPELDPPSADDYFNDQPRMNSNFSKTNYFQNTKIGAIHSESKTEMRMIDYKQDDRNLTFLLIDFSVQTDYESVKLEKEYVKNHTYLEEQRLMQEKIDKMLMTPTKFKPRQLFDRNSIEELKKDFEITYPVYQFDFFSWKGRLIIDINIKPYQNQIQSAVILNIEGIVNQKIFERTDNVQFSQTIDKMIDFLYKAYASIQQLENEISTEMKEILGTNIVQTLEEIAKIVKFPFDIEALFQENFDKLKEEINTDIEAFIKMISHLLKTNEINFKNPLNNITTYLSDRSDIDVLDFLGNIDDNLKNSEKEKRSDFSLLLDLAQNASNLFPDVIDDLNYLQQLLTNTFTDIPSKVNLHIQKSFKEIVNIISNNVTQTLNESHSKLRTLIMGSGFSLGLKENVNYLKKTFDNTFGEIKTWANDFSINFSFRLDNKTDIFSNVGNTATKLVVNLNRQIDDLKDYINNKTVSFEELKKYDKLSEDFNKVSINYNEWRYKNFKNFFGLSEMLDHTVNYSKNYLEAYFSEYLNVEQFMHDYYNGIKKNVDSIIYEVLKNVNQYNLNIKQLVKDISDINTLYTGIISSYQLMSVSKINNSIINVLPLFSNFAEEIKKRSLEKGDLVITCQEEVDMMNLYISSSQSLFDSFNIKVTNYLTQSLETISNSVKNIYNFSDIENAAIQFYSMNNISVNVEQPVNSLEVINSIQNAFDQIKDNINSQISDIVYNQNFKEILDFYQSKVQEIVVYLTNYTMIVNCAEKNIQSSNSVNTFCSIFDLTVTEYNSYLMNSSDSNCNCVRKCVNEDQLRSEFEKYNNSDLFETIPLSTISISNSTLFYMKEKLESTLNSINNKTELLKEYCDNLFDESDNQLNTLLNLEKNKVQEMLFDKNIQELENIFTDQVSTTMKNLLRKYNETLVNIRNLLPNSSVPLFVINKLQNLYNEVNADLENHVNWLQTEVRIKINMTLDNMVLVHENNNNNIVRYFKLLTNSFIPYALNDKFRQKINKFETSLNKFYLNTRTLTQRILEFIQVSLNIDYDSFRSRYSSNLASFKSIIDFAVQNQEDINKNITSAFEYNSYEKVKETKMVYENFIYPLDIFSENYVEGNNEIINKISEINFNQFNNRFISFTQRNPLMEETIYQLTVNNFDNILVMGVENLKFYLRNDNQIKDQIFSYVNEVNSTINNQINYFKNNLFRRLDEWVSSIDNQTTIFLKLYNNSVTVQNLKNFKDFQNNVISKLSISYSSLINDFDDFFYKNIIGLTNLIKNDFLNKTQNVLYSLRANVSKNMKISNNSIRIYERLHNFEENYVNTLSSLYDQIMSNIPFETEESLDYLLDSIREKFEVVQKNMVENLLKVQKTLQINNKLYLINEQSRNHSDFVQVILNPASNFEQEMFTFLKERMTNYTKLISKVNLHAFNTKPISNLSSFIDNKFQLFSIKNQINNLQTQLNGLFSYATDQVNNLNITTQLPLLNELLNFHYSSLLTPIKRVIYSDSFVSFFYNQSLDNFQQINQVSAKTFTDIKGFVDSLINRTEIASLHSLIMIEMKNSLYIERAPSSLKDKPDILLNAISSTLEKNLIKIKSELSSKLDTIIQIVPSNSSEGEMIRKSIQNYIDTVINSSIEADLNEGHALFNSSVILPLKDFYTSTLDKYYNDVNIAFRQLQDSIKERIAGIIDQYPQQNQMYQIILNNINNLNNFNFIPFIASTSFTNKIGETRIAFKSFIDYLIDMIMGFIDPLNKAIDGWIIKFAGVIRDTHIIPTIRENILVPIENLRQKIVDYCVNFMNKVTDRIIQIAESILNPSFNQIVPIYNLPVKRNMEKIDLQELDDIVEEFKNIYVNAVNYIKNLPSIKKIIDTFNTFSDDFNNGISNIIKNIFDKLKDFFITIDPSKVQELNDKINAAMVDIDQTIKREFVDVTDLIKETQDVIQSFTFNSIESVLINAINQCKERLVTTLVSDLNSKNWPSWNWDHGERYSYDLWLPIGPVDLDFGFAFDWRVWFKINTGIRVLDVYSDFQLGASTSVEASAGVGLPLLEVVGYIKGVLARVQADFNLDYDIPKFKAGLKLVFSGAFGEVTVGVGMRTMIQISKLICWLEKVVRNICDWCFLSWICDLVFDWIQVCKWSTFMDWSSWTDFYHTKIFTAYEFNHVALLKQLG